MQVSYQFHSNNEDDTEILARHLSRLFSAGAVITLDGDLGAGKTRFSQAVARAIGVSGIVNSPTFTIIKEYEGTQFPFYHMDVYRISLEEAEDLGLDEYFYGTGITLVEWSSLIEDILPEERLSIYIENNGGQKRSFRMIPHGMPYSEWCQVLKENEIIQ